MCQFVTTAKVIRTQKRPTVNLPSSKILSKESPWPISRRCRLRNMANDRKLVRIEYGHIIKTIKSLERLLKSRDIDESTRRHAKEVKELLDKQVESLNSGESKN